MRVATLRVIASEVDEASLYEATALCAWNAAIKGDNDVLPWSAEFRILRGYTRELADAVWAGEDPAAVEEVLVPLSRLTHRYAHLTDPPTYLRLFGPVLAVADRLEAGRVLPSIATAARWAPNRSRGRILRPGAYERWDDGVACIERRFPCALHLDLATFFPSLEPQAVYGALAPYGAREARLFLDQLKRTRIRGLPVGGAPARLVAEAWLHRLDVALIQLGRQHVRALDDVEIGVESEQDAEQLVVQAAAAIRPLDLNKSKTNVRYLGGPAPEPRAVDIVRGLLAQPDPDRVQLARALGRVHRELPTWDGRKRHRWLHLLADAVVRVRVRVPQILRMIGKLVADADGLQLESLQLLLDSPDAVNRAEAARFLSRQHRDGGLQSTEGPRRVLQARLTRLAVADRSAMVRRESLLGLVRLGAKAEVVGLVRGVPPTQLDRGAWIVASAVLDAPLQSQLILTPYHRLLHRAACEHSPRDI